MLGNPALSELHRECWVTALCMHALPQRAEGKIKHSRVQQEGQLIMLGTSEFDSLVDMVSYYKKHPLYRKMVLRYPINQETLEKIGTAVSSPASQPRAGRSISPFSL